MKVALFDLDHTLIEGDSEMLWTQRAAALGLGDAGPMAGFSADYAAGTLDIDAYYAYSFGIFAGRTPTDFEAELAAFLTDELLPILRPLPLARLEAERADGAVTALVTASGEWVTRGIAQALGFDALIATRLERRGGRFTGQVAGTPSFERGKLERVEAWLAGRGTTLEALEDSSFYGDSGSDRFIMERVRRPVAVGPDKSLRTLSIDRDWEVLEVR